MYDFAPRIDSTAADTSATSRVVPAVSPVQAVATQSGSSSDAGGGADSGETTRRQHMASAADYARAHAQISRILADMDRKVSSVQVQQAATDEMNNMVAHSTVIVPLPPASTESMERAIQTARDMVRLAELSRSSHANLSVGTVSKIVAEA